MIGLAQAWHGKGHMKMNNANAVGFLLLGTLFQVLPWLGASELGANANRTLWLQIMGVVTGGVGVVFLLNSAVGALSAAIARLALRRQHAGVEFAQGARAHQSMSLEGRATF